MRHESTSRPTAKLPRRDIILLPMIFILTCLALCVIGEISCRVIWRESEDDACVVPDAVLGHRARGNCTSMIKAAEGPWVTNHYNACGYRTDQPCDKRPAGTVRIDLLGSSTAQGYLVPYQSTIGATLDHTLTAACHHDVQIENMAMFDYRQAIVFAQLNEALGLKPDIIMFLVQPFDFERDGDDMAQAKTSGSGSPELLHQFRNLMSNLRIMEVAQHFMFKDPDRYASFYLNYGDRADFMRPPFTKAWRDRLAYFDDLLTRMETTIKLSGVPMVVVFVPTRAQAALLAEKRRPPGVDPFAFGQAVGKIAAAHGFSYIDLSTAFSQDADPGDLFYAQNGHLTAHGDVTVAKEIGADLMANTAMSRLCQE